VARIPRCPPPCAPPSIKRTRRMMAKNEAVSVSRRRSQCVV
jgi:hypothetical protein